MINPIGDKKTYGSRGLRVYKRTYRESSYLDSDSYMVVVERLPEVPSLRLRRYIGFRIARNRP